VDNQPQIFVVPSSFAEDRPPEKASVVDPTHQNGAGLPRATFFGHHVAELLASEKAEVEEFQVLDKELESSLETVRRKLTRSQPVPGQEPQQVSEEETKHKQFIEERNRAQEQLFLDILDHHRQFETGLTPDDLWSLHDLIKKEAAHEGACALEGSFHELVECNLLRFLRHKAVQQAWRFIEMSLARLDMDFPIPGSMIAPSQPARNEEVREERKRAAGKDLMALPGEHLAELILGNVPVWVYSYPAPTTHLWQLTVLQGVAAGLAAHHLMNYLAIWEERSSNILSTIQSEFLAEIRELRQRGESATDFSEAMAATMEIQRISREEIPQRIWDHIEEALKA